MKRSRPEWVSGLKGLVLRVRLSGDREVSCLPSELPALAQWLVAGGRGPMPVREFTKHPWRKSYRWTLAAWLVALRELPP